MFTKENGGRFLHAFSSFVVQEGDEKRLRMKEKEVMVPDVHVVTLYTWFIRSVTVLLYSCIDIEFKLGLGRTKRKKAEECTC